MAACWQRTAPPAREPRSYNARSFTERNMKQVWITRNGGPEVLEVREAPDPEPGEGQVRIRVAAAGLNFADTAARIGLYPDAPKLPAVMGYEVSGTLDKLGPNATGSVGARVL